MSLNSVLTQDQASDLNLATSIRQYVATDIVAPYNTAASAAGLSPGVILNSDGTTATDTLGLGIVEASPEDRGLYQRVPVVGYTFDMTGVRDSVPTGAGDMANFERRSVKLCCLPVVKADGAGHTDPQRLAQWVLKSAVVNALKRKQTAFPIVDHGGTPVAGLYPAIGYAWIENVRPLSMEKLADLLDVHKYRFDVLFDICWTVEAS